MARGHGRLDRGRHGSRQHAIYRHILKKFSRYGRRSREAEEPAPTPAANTNSKSTGGPILPEAPDVTADVPTYVSKLPDVVSNATTKSASNSDSTMSRLGGPQQPASQDKDSGRSRNASKDNDTDGDSKQAGRGLGRRVIGGYLPPPGTFRPNEVLAINLNSAGLAIALARSFKLVERVEFPALGFNVTRLETPSVQNALIGRTTLHEELPTDGFGLNHIYAAGRTASAAPVAPARSTLRASPVRPVIGCTPDRCFGVSTINWNQQLSACAHGIKIGVIDTGVDKSHPTFAGLRFEHKDFVPRNTKKPSNQHGTGIFSLLAGNVRSSTPGLVPSATFLVGDAFFADRHGNAVSDTVTMLKALNWLKASRVDVANLSFAGPEDEFVHDAIRELAKTGTVILAAAGNEGQNAPPSYPAAYQEVIAVTAVDRSLSAYMYANRGNYIDVAAPGVDVWTALPGRREGPQTGTSFAVPFVTSVVALNYPTANMRTDGDPLAPKQRGLALLQKGIKAIGNRGRTPIFGAGLVQAPDHCNPRPPGAVASVGRRENAWGGMVRAAPVQPGSWASTVHPASNHK